MNADSFGFVGRGTSALHLKKNLEHEGISMNVANGLLVDGQMMIRSTESNINMRVGDLFFFFSDLGSFVCFKISSWHFLGLGLLCFIAQHCILQQG